MRNYEQFPVLCKDKNNIYQLRYLSEFLHTSLHQKAISFTAKYSFVFTKCFCLDFLHENGLLI